MEGDGIENAENNSNVLNGHGTSRVEKDIPSNEKQRAYQKTGRRLSANKEGLLISRQKQIADRVKFLTKELSTAKNEAKLAAEIGQQLLVQDQEKTKALEDLECRLNNERETVSTLVTERGLLLEEKRELNDIIEDTKAECKLLEERNVQLCNKLEVVNREALKMGASISDFEEQVLALTAARDTNVAQIRELQIKVFELEQERSVATPPSENCSRIKRAMTTGGKTEIASPSPVIDSATPHRKRSATSTSRQKLNLEAHGGEEELLCPSSDNHESEDDASSDKSDEDEDEDEEELLFNTPSKVASKVGRLQGQLHSARLENQRSQKKISQLRSELQKRHLERCASVKKMEHLETHLNEYQQLVESQTELASSYKQCLDGAEPRDDGSGSIETAMLKEELEMLKKHVQQEAITAVLREDDLNKVVDQLHEVQDRLYTEKGSTVTLRKRRDSNMYTTVDMGIVTDPIQLLDLSESDSLQNIVQRPGFHGRLLVKRGLRFPIFGRSSKWKAKIAELRPPHLLLFRNEWDSKPCNVIPIDGSEVRIVRRPHYDDDDISTTAEDADFRVTVTKAQTPRKKRQLAKTMSVNSFFSNSLHAQEQASRKRSFRVLHEFHIWHPNRPVIYLSAPSHVDMSKWAEMLQVQSATVNVRPRRYAAGYLTLCASSSDEDQVKALKRYFAVLRSDGIHLYTHPSKRRSKHVIVIENHTRILTPQVTSATASSDRPLGRSLCISSREQGRTILQADTDMDRDWWADSIRAHGLGVVSWGSLHGMRNDQAFATLSV
mmetsp:Transcript_37555/g.61059  ORF Transcript_37555/g.61059 Transcript_37555/m.61059 type:complete len:781 (+) Transcript_37555:453-2795(+)